jgi:hypothetical protein
VTPEVSEGREGWPAGRPSAPNCLKLVVEILLTSYKYPPNFDGELTLESLWCSEILACLDTQDITSVWVIC